MNTFAVADALAEKRWRDGVRIGVVTDAALATGLIAVEAEGEALGACRYLTSYTPSNGHVVLVIGTGGKFVVLGRLGALA